MTHAASRQVLRKEGDDFIRLSKGISQAPVLLLRVAWLGSYSGAAARSFFCINALLVPVEVVAFLCANQDHKTAEQQERLNRIFLLSVESDMFDMLKNLAENEFMHDAQYQPILAQMTHLHNLGLPWKSPDELRAARVAVLDYH